MGKIIDTSRKAFAICSILGFCGASLLMLILAITEDTTGSEMLSYFFVSWVLFSAVAWVGLK